VARSEAGAGGHTEAIYLSKAGGVHCLSYRLREAYPENVAQLHCLPALHFHSSHRKPWSCSCSLRLWHLLYLRIIAWP
jgi:hypothetical protein